MARVLGSYPIGRWFEPNCRYHIAAVSLKSDGAYGPMVKRPKTSPFHGGNSGSNPDGVTIFVVRKSYNRQKAQDIAYLVLFCYYIL